MSEARSKVAEVLDKANKIVFGQDWMLESLVKCMTPDYTQIGCCQLYEPCSMSQSLERILSRRSPY